MEKFNLLAGLLFGRLYEDFPVPLRIAPEQFLEEVIDEDDFEGSFNFIEYFESTVRWLESEDFIRITQDRSEEAVAEFEVVLSEKGLGALRKVPSSLEGTASLGERFSGFAKCKTSEAVGTLISLAITGGTNSAASFF